MTFGELNQRYLTDQLGGRESQAKFARIYRQFFATWTEHPTRFQLHQWHKGLSHTKPHANAGLGYLKAMYNWASITPDATGEKALWEGVNPADGIPMHTVYSRERVMDHRELKLIVNSLDMIISSFASNRKNGKKYQSAYMDGVRQKYQAWFTCRLLVPCRIKELCTMQWADIDAHGKWTKPHTKNGRTHTIHIPRQARELIFKLPRTCDSVFPGQYGKPITEEAIGKVWRRWRGDLGISNLYVLDFRRTLSTYLYRVLKVDDLTAKAVLNHYDSRPVAIYTKLDYDYLASIIQGYADWVDEFRTSSPSSPYASDSDDRIQSGDCQTTTHESLGQSRDCRLNTSRPVPTVNESHRKTYRA